MSVHITAELSGNHNGDIGRAKALIHAAKEAGANSVKIQTYTPATMTLNVRTEPFMIKEGPWAGKSLWELYGQATTPWEWHEELFEEARDVGIELFSTPFDVSAVEFLEMLECPRYKLASFEVNHWPLIERLCDTEKPIIISTGACSYDEVHRAWRRLRRYGSSVTVLHCISEYPAGPYMNLEAMNSWRFTPGTKLGLSDHSLGSVAAVVAASMGARVIEKHLCLKRSDGGPDSGFSMEPEEFKEMVKQVRLAEKVMKKDVKAPQSSYQNLKRSIWITKSVKRGDVVTAENIGVLRPSGGLDPKYYSHLMGLKFGDNYEPGVPLSADKLYKGRVVGKRGNKTTPAIAGVVQGDQEQED